MLALGRVHRRIELDQHLARLHRVAVMHMDRADDADLEGLDDLGPPARDDLARGGRDNVDGAEAGPGQGQHEHGNDRDRKSTRLNSSHDQISYAVFCLKKKKTKHKKSPAVGKNDKSTTNNKTVNDD